MKNNIRELRTALSLTQSELAQQLGLNQSAIGKYERGELEPSISTLKKMSFIFECSIDYIIGNADDFGNIVIKEKSPAPALTQAEQDLLDDFFLSFNKDSDLYVGVQQGDNGQSMVLGGIDKDGNDCFNELSRLCLMESLSRA